MFFKVSNINYVLILITCLVFTSSIAQSKYNDYLKSTYQAVKWATYFEYTYDKTYNDTLKAIAIKIDHNVSASDLVTDYEKYHYYEAKFAHLGTVTNANKSRYIQVIDSLYKTVKDKKLTLNLLKIQAIAYDHENNIGKAVELFLEAKEIAELMKDEDEINACNNHILYMFNNRFKRDSSWYDKQEKIAQLLEAKTSFNLSPQPEQEEDDHIGLSLSYFLYQTSFNKYHEEEVSFVKQKNDIILKEKRNNNFEKTVNAYDNLVKYYTVNQKDNKLYYNILLSYAQYLLKNQKYVKALEVLNMLNKYELQSIGYEIFDYELFINILIDVHEKTGDYANALLYTKFKDKYKINQRLLGDFGFQYIQDFYRLKKENSIELKKNKVLILVTSGLSVLLLIIMFQSILYNRSKKHRNSLESINEELRTQKEKTEFTLNSKIKLEKKLINIQKYVAKDLHDNFGNRLVGLNTTINIIEDILSKPKINHYKIIKYIFLLNTNINKLSTDIKDLLWASNPKNNSLKEIIYRIEKFCSKLEFGDLKINRVYDLENSDYTLPNFWNRQLFLITKEALNNSIKHSGSNKIDLLIFIDKKGYLKIKIKDYGKGIDLNSLKRKSGLSNMPYRAKLIDLEYNIASKPGKGLEINLKSKTSILDLI